MSLPGLDGRRMPSRVRGRYVLERSLRSLLLRVIRFAEHRAESSADQVWAARVVDTLRGLLELHPPSREGDCG